MVLVRITQLCFLKGEKRYPGQEMVLSAEEAKAIEDKYGDVIFYLDRDYQSSASTEAPPVTEPEVAEEPEEEPAEESEEEEEEEGTLSFSDATEDEEPEDDED